MSDAVSLMRCVFNIFYNSKFVLQLVCARLWKNIILDNNKPELLIQALYVIGRYDIIEDTLSLCSQHNLLKVFYTILSKKKYFYIPDIF